MSESPPMPPAPMRLIVMGVSGCGKSTVAHALAERLGLHMVDGDDLHLPGSVAKMRAAIFDLHTACKRGSSKKRVALRVEREVVLDRNPKVAQHRVTQ